MFANIEEEIYNSTFDSIYYALMEEYKEGSLSVETLEMNITEQQQILLNGLFEGETKFAYSSALVDAHQFALAVIKKEKTID
ncbi:MAG: hypothetical protein RR191_01795 [Cetobacterium sp.]|uniref:hypothetical protein n=1 Tax=unclassified Cetobacterium TaxID=2630983 RepID=UPI00163B8634|nr:hypothetical protein [Cetobacterium sp. 2A]MBC2855782.1 hypothetical protein [Cetobacterium sp. 2A]